MQASIFLSFDIPTAPGISLSKMVELKFGSLTRNYHALFSTAPRCDITLSQSTQQALVNTTILVNSMYTAGFRHVGRYLLRELMDPKSNLCLQNSKDGPHRPLFAILLLLRMTGQSKLNMQRKIYMSFPFLQAAMGLCAHCSPRRLPNTHALLLRDCSDKARTLSSLPNRPSRTCRLQQCGRHSYTQSYTWDSHVLFAFS